MKAKIGQKSFLLGKFASSLFRFLDSGESISFIPEITAPSIKLSPWIVFMLPPINEWSAVLVKLPSLLFVTTPISPALLNR